ncbi:hypothetical protein DSECCO2_80000 [anaerobic digester metagenome]
MFFADTDMLSSNSSHNGNATRIRLKTSGGVITAATTRITTKAWRLYFLRKSGVIIPAFVRKKTSTGSSNNNPVANVTEVIDDIYDDRLI